MVIVNWYGISFFTFSILSVIDCFYVLFIPALCCYLNCFFHIGNLDDAASSSAVAAVVELMDQIATLLMR